MKVAPKKHREIAPTGLRAGDLEGAPQPSSEPLTQPIARVLFLCRGNDARSQMAEAILRQFSGGRVAAYSAGQSPAPVHPLAVGVMRRHSVDITRQRSKHVNEFQGQAFNLVITLLDDNRETCSPVPGVSQAVCWNFPDPAAVEGDEETRQQAFQTTAQELMTRIRLLLLVLEKTARGSQETSRAHPR
jgi:protein-tyrosine-phosphatase